MRFLKTIFPLLLISCFTFFTPDTASAQEFITCNGPDCSACNLVDMGNTLLVWIIGIGFVFFAVIAVVAGFGLVTSGGNPSALQAAKDKFVNAFIGLIIILAAWLLVDTIMVALLTGSGGEIDGYGPWSQVQCQVQLESSIVEAELALIEDSTLISQGLATTSLATGDVTVAPNCGFDESALVSIPGEGSHRAVEGVATRYVNMRSAASEQGISLRVTSSYRSDAYQTQLWDDCPRCQNEGTVARPCSRGGNGSRHSAGVALDISSSGGRAQRCETRNLCRSAGASFIMFYENSDHVHCDWGGSSGEVNVSC